jgi:hypothetical protein
LRGDRCGDRGDCGQKDELHAILLEHYDSWRDPIRLRAGEKRMSPRFVALAIPFLTEPRRKSGEMRVGGAWTAEQVRGDGLPVFSVLR